MSRRAVAWLRARQPAPPEALLERMSAALAGTDEEAALEEVLAAAALRELEDALAMGDTRAAATPLLSADALLTGAFEAAAEHGGAEAVSRLADAYDLARFERLLGDRA